MFEPRFGPLVRQLHRWAADELTDVCLLERFRDRQDADAFAAIVRRHGPLVWRVCRRVLGRNDGAEDCLQATFLVLTRKARSIRKPAALASWLYGVAFRVARAARAGLPRQQLAEGPEPLARTAEPGNEAAGRELGRMVEEEVHALPEKLRLPILLCYWQGLTNAEAAGALGWPAGTVKTRLARARDLLHERLGRRGVTLPASALACWLAAGASEAALPLTLAATALRSLPSHGMTGAGSVSTRVAALADVALRASLLAKGKLVAVLAVALLVAGLGAGAMSQPPQPQPLERVPEPAAKGKPLDTPLPRHTFGPIQAGWIKKVHYLERAPESFTVIEPQARDPKRDDYYREERYTQPGAAKEARIRRFYPDGSLFQDIENLGKAQFSKQFYVDGGLQSFMHWRDGRWLNGYSVSSDGKELHRLIDGKGELVSYHEQDDSRSRRWYADGTCLLDKRYRQKALTEARLDCADGWFIVSKNSAMLQLRSRKGTWSRSGSGMPQFHDFKQGLDQPVEGRRRLDPDYAAFLAFKYERDRSAFVERFGQSLKKAGHTWEALGIDFIRKGAAWPF